MSINTDTNKLIQRIQTHKNFSKFDINKWILQHISLQDKEKLLDLGCGTGEQIIKLIHECPNSNIVGIDASQTSLKIINDFCDKNNLKNVKTICGDLNDLSSIINSINNFDVVISCFALYYSQDLVKLISYIKKILKPKGRFFVCGPMEGNNAELIEFQSQISKKEIIENKPVMTSEILPEISKKFNRVSKDYFSNPTCFPNANSIIDYWKSYYLYDTSIEQQFTDRIKKYFEQNKEFVTTKKVIGITAYS